MNTSHLLPFVHLFVEGPFSPVCGLVVFLWLLALLLGAECELYVCCVSFYSACPMHMLPTHLLTPGLFCCICTIPHLGGFERGAIFALQIYSGCVFRATGFFFSFFFCKKMCACSAAVFYKLIKTRLG